MQSGAEAVTYQRIVREITRPWNQGQSMIVPLQRHVAPFVKLFHVGDAVLPHHGLGDVRMGRRRLVDMAGWMTFSPLKAAVLLHAQR